MFTLIIVFLFSLITHPQPCSGVIFSITYRSVTIKFSPRLKDNFSLLQLSSCFHSFAIIPFGNNDILFTKLIAESCEHGNVAKNKSDVAKTQAFRWSYRFWTDPQVRKTACCLLPASALTYRTYHSCVQTVLLCKEGLSPTSTLSLLFLSPSCLEIMAKTMKDFSCNKVESSFNVDDIWTNFRGSGLYRKTSSI